MTVKERIQAEIESLNDAELEDLYELVRLFARTRQPRPAPRPAHDKTTLIAKLKRITIDGPEDFAVNHDRYVLGRNGG